MPGPTGPGTVWYPPHYSTCQLIVEDWSDTTGTGAAVFAAAGPAALRQLAGDPVYDDPPLVDVPDGSVPPPLYYDRPTVTYVTPGASPSLFTGIVDSAQHWGGAPSQYPQGVMYVTMFCRDYRAWDAYWPHRSNIVTIPVNVTGGSAAVANYPTPPNPIPYDVFYPMSDLVAAIPDTVQNPDDWEWVNGSGTTIATPPVSAPLGGGVWGFPPRPFHATGWTEVGRFPMVPGPEGTNGPGCPPPGPGYALGGAWNITVDLDVHLRDGRLTIVFADDNWFAGDLAAYNLRQNPENSGNDTYTSEAWGIYSIWTDPPKVVTPPLRMRQRWVHGSSHDGQARTHPVTKRARGDIG